MRKSGRFSSTPGLERCCGIVEPGGRKAEEWVRCGLGASDRGPSQIAFPSRLRALVKAKGSVVGGLRLQVWRGSLDLQGRTLGKRIDDYSPVLLFQLAILPCPGEYIFLLISYIADCGNGSDNI